MHLIENQSNCYSFAATLMLRKFAILIMSDHHCVSDSVSKE